MTGFFIASLKSSIKKPDIVSLYSYSGVTDWVSRYLGAHPK